ncbi:MAG: phosphodiester glycosidase family protein [Clostridiales bacterium]|nr:phosphodiester glycosidase family protein [Clostridiales bacterium]
MKIRLRIVICLLLLLSEFFLIFGLPHAVRAEKAIAWAKTGELAREGFPLLTAEGFLPEGEREYIFIDEEEGVWRYASQSLRIQIKRTAIAEKGKKLRYLCAEIFLKEGSEGFRMVAHHPDHLMENRDLYKDKPVNIAKNNHLVFSMDGDYYIYRVTRRQNTGPHYPVGIVIRDGRLLMEAPIRMGSEAYPPLDMLALFADGDMKAFLANEVTASQLLSMGARDVLSFGPVLVKDGQLGSFHPVRGATPQPRAGIGMYAPGHYLAIIAEGRIKQSSGMSSKEFGELFLSYDCPLAFNLDGGWTSAMVFMGKQLNQLDNVRVKDNARNQNEVMGIGYTDYDQHQ